MCLFPLVFAELNKRMHVAYSPKYSNIFQLELAANKIQKQLLEQHCCQVLFEQSAQKVEKKLEKLTNQVLSA
jgi:hypothetical protein